MKEGLRGSKTRRQLLVLIRPDVITERAGLYIWAMVSAGKSDRPMAKDTLRLSFAGHAPAAFGWLASNKRLAISMIVLSFLSQEYAAGGQRTAGGEFHPRFSF